MMAVKQPEKWRETMNPSTLTFEHFQLEEILGYPHAGNDVFYVRGKRNNGEEIKAFLKVERQKTADIEREVAVIQKLPLSIKPPIIDYSFSTPKYLLTGEVQGSRLSVILGENEEKESLKYMGAYGELLAKIHTFKIEAEPVKHRDFTLPHAFYVENNLTYIEEYLATASFEESMGFIHGDCHYANILWEDFEVSCLLDYELSGYGSREYDLAWALVLRPGQKFLQTQEEREVFLEAYREYHDFSQEAFDYYFVLFGIFFYKISPGEDNARYREILLEMIDGIVER